jgi:hypothetical protein
MITLISYLGLLVAALLGTVIIYLGLVKIKLI